MKVLNVTRKSNGKYHFTMMYFAWTFFAYSKNFIIYVDRYLGDVSTHACAQLFKCNVNSDTTFKTEQHLIYQNPITLFSLETWYFSELISADVSHERSSASKFECKNTRVFSVCKQLCAVVTLPQEHLHHPLTSSSSRGLSQLSSEFTHHNCD